MKKLSREYNLEVCHPELMNEWCYPKNEKLPSSYYPQSNKSVWWQCPKSKYHIYEAKIANKTKLKSGCPYCVNQKVCEDNNLKYKLPYLAREWHPNKNGDLTPSKVVWGSDKNVWWMCSRGHEWKASPKTRSYGINCGKCSGNQTSKFELRLLSELESVIGKVVHRKVINKDEIDIYLPYYKVGIEYDGWYYHKNKIDKDKKKNQRLKKIGVPIIRIREEVKGNVLPKISKNDVFRFKRDKDLEIVKKVIISLSKIVEFSISRKKIIDKYLNDDELWNDEGYHGYFELLLKPPLEKSVQYKYPKILKSWHPTKNKNLLPTDLSFGTKLELWWICDKNPKHEYKRTPSTQNMSKSRCPFCSNIIIDESNSLSSLYPSLTKQWHPIKNGNLKPSEIGAGSGMRVWWKCSEGVDHEFNSTIGGRIRINPKTKKKYISNCPFCEGKKVSITNSLETMNPKVAKEFHPTKNKGMTPQDVHYGSKKKYWFTCGFGHEWEAVLAPRTKRNVGCPYCKGQKIGEDNNLEVKFPEIAKQFHPTKNGNVKPNSLSPHTFKRFWWVCSYNHEWESSVNNRTKPRGCPYCRGNRKK